MFLGPRQQPPTRSAAPPQRPAPRSRRGGEVLAGSDDRDHRHPLRDACLLLPTLTAGPGLHQRELPYSHGTCIGCPQRRCKRLIRSGAPCRMPRCFSAMAGWCCLRRNLCRKPSALCWHEPFLLLSNLCWGRSGPLHAGCPPTARVIRCAGSSSARGHLRAHGTRVIPPPCQPLGCRLRTAAGERGDEGIEPGPAAAAAGAEGFVRQRLIIPSSSSSPGRRGRPRARVCARGVLVRQR
mmetsp:Transcript_100593/g.285052  ORF Transcript_100593/g.285052 Transcript_100593/m.285052 type:complete len:238 (+) Transcript_100593:100-813(+)